MIKAKHNPFAEKLYKAGINRLLRSNFAKFKLLNDFPLIENTKGLIVTPNHFSWWDGFFAEYVMRKFTNRRPFLMMLERQLKKYWFFRYAGAFSIDPGHNASVKESMDYAKKISQSNNDYLIFYPQGEIQLYENDFIKLKKGLTLLTSETKVNVLLMTFKIVFNEDKYPTVYCRFGEMLSAAKVNSDFAYYENSFRENIKNLDGEVYQNQAKDLFRK